MITADSGSTKPSSRIGTLPSAFRLVDPGRPVAEVDLDRLERRCPSRRGRAGRGRRYGQRGASTSLTARAPSSRAICSYSSCGRRQLGRRRAPCARPARTSSRSAPVSRATSVGFALERELVALRQRAVERRHGEVLVDHAAALVEAEADDAPRARARARRRRRRAARRAPARGAPARRGRRRAAGRRSGSSRSPSAVDLRRLEPRHELRERALDREAVVALDVGRRRATARSARRRAGARARRAASPSRARPPRSRAAARPSRATVFVESTSRLSRAAPCSPTSATQAATSAFATPWRRARGRT